MNDMDTRLRVRSMAGVGPETIRRPRLGAESYE